MKQHIMDLITHRPDGSSEWLCPICGRRLAFTRSGSCTILKPGNDGVDHVGEAHGLKLTSPALTSRKNEPVELPEVFKRWAAEHGVE